MNKLKEIIEKIRNIKIFNVSIFAAIYIFLYMLEIFFNANSLINIPKELFDGPFYYIEMGCFYIAVILELLSSPVVSVEKIAWVLLYFFAKYNIGCTGNFALYNLVIILLLIRKDKFEDVINLISNILIGFIAFSIVYYFYCFFITKTTTTPFTFGYGSTFTFDIAYKNTFGMYITSILGTKLYIYYGDKKLTKYIISLLISVFTLLLCTSKTAFIIAIVMIFLFFIVERFEDKLKKPLKVISYIVFPLCLISMVFVTYLYMQGSSIGLWINKLLTTRVYLQSLLVENATPTFLGTVEKTTEMLNGSYCDALYPYFVYKYGCIWLIIFEIGFIFATIKGDIRDHILVFLFSIYGLSEHVIYNPAYLFMVLVFVKAIKDDTALLKINK